MFLFFLDALHLNVLTWIKLACIIYRCLQYIFSCLNSNDFTNKHKDFAVHIKHNPVLFFESTVVRPGQKSVNYNVIIYVILVNNNLAVNFIGARNQSTLIKLLTYRLFFRSKIDDTTP